MKKSIFILAVSTCIVGITLTGCKSNSDKEADAIENIDKAVENLEDVKQDIVTDSITKANDTEWQMFKTEANNTITANEVRIEELKKALKKTGNKFDVSYEKSITTLEQKNASLKTKIENYENNQTDWQSFKREFNADMNQLGKALKDLTVDNKK